MASSQCCDNPPVLDPGSGKGFHLDNLGGLKAYVAGSASSSKAVILVSDIFGYESPLLRELADKVASFGYYTIVPDFFHGEPLAPGPELMAELPAWLEKHGPVKGSEDAKPVIEALKEKGIVAVGVAGFCWGGKVVAELAKTDYIKAGVMLHPSLVTVDDIKEVKRPLSILGAEVDHATPPELAKQFEEILSTKSEVPSFVKIFPGTSHGWAVRYDGNNEKDVLKAEEAHKDMLDWFAKYVK